MKRKKIVRRTVMLGLYIWISSVLLIFHGPFPALRNFVYGSVATMSYVQLLAPLTLWNVKPVPKWKLMQTEVNSGRLARSTPAVNPTFSHVLNNSLELHTYSEKNFSAQILLVHNPKSVRLIVTKNLGSGGETVSEIASRTHAIAAINAGGFQDRNWQGTGGQPIGTTIHDFKVVTFDEKYPTIGFTNTGILEVGYFSRLQLRQNHIKEAASFGPILVLNGQGVVQGDGGWGSAPRTAIGQRRDGTVIMIVTDGRLVHGPSDFGATLSDLEMLMLRYGAVNAANLDGGSSSTLLINGKLINTPTDILGERKVATSFVVMPTLTRKKFR